MVPLSGQTASEAASSSPLCRAPFAQLHFDPHGYVAVCSKSTHRRLGHVATADLRRLWLGSGIEAVRSALSSQHYPEGCESCAWNDASGNVLNHPARCFDERPLPPDPTWPAHLEFAFSNVCNLACVQCSPELSSTIRAHHGLPPMASPYGDAFFAQLEPFLAHALGITFLGGEPFLQRECFRVLDLLIAADRGIPIHVTTNGTRLDAEVARVLDALPMQLAISLDGASPAAIERIRLGANGRQLLANVHVFARHARAHGRLLKLNFCVMRENWQELPDFFLLAQELGAAVWVVPVTHPEQHCLFTLPHERLREVAAAWRARAPEVLRAADARMARTWTSLEEMVERALTDAAPREVWHPAQRLREALLAFARGETTDAFRDPLPEPPGPDASKEERSSAALDVVARLARLDQSGVAGGEEFARLATRLADEVAKCPEDFVATRFGGTMEVAWRLDEAGLHASAVAVAACTPPSDPLHVRALLFRSCDHLRRGDLAGAQRLLDELARAGVDTAEYNLRRGELDLKMRRVEEAAAALARAERRLQADASPEAWLVEAVASASRRVA